MKFVYMTISLSLSLSLSLFVVIRALAYELLIGWIKPPYRFYSRLLLIFFIHLLCERALAEMTLPHKNEWRGRLLVSKYFFWVLGK